MKKVMLIINPTSGGEKALDYKVKLENKAKDYLSMWKPKLPKKRQTQHTFAEEASREQYDAVVVFGGDGTVNEVISGIAERDYIPKQGLSQAVQVTSLRNCWKSIKTSDGALMNLILT